MAPNLSVARTVGEPRGCLNPVQDIHVDTVERVGRGRSGRVIRDAEARDVAATLAIYNELIPTTTVAWTDLPTTLEARIAWTAHQQARSFPVLVAEHDGVVVGVASFSDFRDTAQWEGYRFSVEHSIHVRGDQRGQGIGRELLGALIARARVQGVHVMVGAIDSENLGSLAFHERMGFVEVARMPETGFKFGRWLDLVLVQRIITSG